MEKGCFILCGKVKLSHILPVAILNSDQVAWELNIVQYGFLYLGQWFRSKYSHQLRPLEMPSRVCKTFHVLRKVF